MEEHLIVVPGGLNTDIIGYGVKKIITAGELSMGGELKVGPGGKARNMAQMAAAYLGQCKVAMIGRSSKDPFGFWQVPIRSLEEAGVDTSHVTISDFSEVGCKYPGIALIPVDQKGRNQIYLLPGVNEDFSCRDIDNASILFENPKNQKILLIALEIPLATVKHAIKKAVREGIRVILDPGGINEQIDELMNEHIFLLKPNEHETRVLTGIAIEDFKSAKIAAKKMMAKGIWNILITHGEHGAYLFNKRTSLHIPVPAVNDTGDHDETGCGDQVTAIVAALLAEGHDLAESARLAVLAGTLQFNKIGIQPIGRQELWRSLKRIQH
jgi:ribokinase